MTTVRAWSERSSSLRRGALTLIIAAALYDALARSGYFPQALTPTLGAIAQRFLRRSPTAPCFYMRPPRSIAC